MDDTEHLGWFANYSADWLATKCFTSARTARRWRRAKRAPTLIVRWLTLVCDGVLGALCKDWEGWTLRDGKLYDPVGRWHTPATLTADHLRMQLNSALMIEVRHLRAELAAARSLTATLAARSFSSPAALGESTGLGSPFHRLVLHTAHAKNTTAPSAMAL